MRRLLVTGASGFLGRHVAAAAVEAGWSVCGTYARNPLAIDGVEMYPLDLPTGAEALIAQLRPSAVIHTAYDRRPDVLWDVTARGAGAVARACAASGARLIHLSSDAIFGGRPEPYGEADSADPITPYGAAKAAAELLVEAGYPQALQVRTSLLYAAPGAATPDPYMLMVQQFLREPGRGALFTDEVRSPLCVDDLAPALVELLDQELSGVLNVAGPLGLSRLEFGQLLARAAGLDPAGLPSGTGRALCRPTRVVLNVDRARQLLRAPLRSPYDVLLGGISL